jgi:hypothetical protein
MQNNKGATYAVCDIREFSIILQFSVIQILYRIYLAN